MPIPSEPDKIVFKNGLYPNGLTAEQIYKYYIKNKRRILKECDRRPVVLFNYYDPTTHVVVQRNRNNQPIILTHENYDEIITGYNISISVETAYPGDLVKHKIIDLDPIGNVTETQMKNAVLELAEFYNYRKYTITNGSRGYHLRVEINKASRKQVLQIMKAELTENFGNKYLINDRSRNRPKSGINLDFIAMQNKGSLTVPYALTRHGVICSPIKNVIAFKRHLQVIR